MRPVDGAVARIWWSLRELKLSDEWESCGEIEQGVVSRAGWPWIVTETPRSFLSTTPGLEQAGWCRKISLV
jgi:hypothetical protein